jgi:N-acetylglucosaminyl-diphospho-decaprenol L-rhamnosyltransferase
MNRDLEIVIVSYNTSDELDACLASIYAHLPARLERLVVVDNASTDSTVARAQSRWSQVHIIALEHNVGFGAANNMALREPGPPLVLLLNSDTIVPPGAIDRLVDRLQATGAVAAGPRLVDASGHPEVSFGPMLTPLAEVGQAFRQRLAKWRDPLSRSYIRRLVSRERTVDWVSGACMLLRRDAVLRAGLFDERFFMYEEDIDLCVALRANGGRILFTPRSEIVHLRGRSVARTGAVRPVHYDRSHVAFYEKHAPAWAEWLRSWQRLRGRGIR